MSPLPVLLAIVLGQIGGGSKPVMEPSTYRVSGTSVATVTLPRFPVRSPLHELAEKAVSDAEQGRARAWAKEMREQYAELMPHTRKYISFDTVTAVKFDSPVLVSVSAHSEFYSGGAHGMSHTRTYNLGSANGKPFRFGVEEAFLRDKASRVALQELLVGRAGQWEGAMWIAQGTVKYLSDTQLSRFWVDHDALVWEFDPYELGPYASGSFTLRVPRMDLMMLIRKDGPLGSWAWR